MLSSLDSFVRPGRTSARAGVKEIVPTLDRMPGFDEMPGIGSSSQPQGWQQPLSHRELVSSLIDVADASDCATAVKLAVVPTSRPDPHLRSGVETVISLARQGVIRNVLFILSKAAAECHGIELLRKRLGELPKTATFWITTLPKVTPALPLFAVDRMPLTSAYRRYAGGDLKNDVGTKRNVALLAAMNLGADHLLFLDDDISPGRVGKSGWTLDAQALRHAVPAVTKPDGASAVGWELRGFDDNSVVCRAAALAGMKQRQFIGAGALLVRVDHATPFFPAIYNEDWLFLLGMLGGVRAPRAAWAYAGDVRQDVYDGYRPQRARSEELGDILGEGLMSLLSADSGSLQRASDPRFWRQVINGRKDRITEILELLRALPGGADSDEAVRARAALGAALEVHTQIAAKTGFWLDQFVSYLAAWRNDLDSWTKTMRDAKSLSLDRLLPGRPPGLRKGRLG